MIIIISHREDQHVKKVGNYIKELGEDYVVLDFMRYPVDWRVSFYLNQNTGKQQTLIETEEKVIEGESVKSVWYRRVSGPSRDCLIYDNPLVSQYIRIECDSFLQSLPFLIPTFWVNTPNDTKLASHKSRQLKLAAEIGFKVPITLVGNSKKSMVDFLKINRSMDKFIVKTIEMSLAKVGTDSKNNLVAYATLVDRMELSENTNRITYCPIIIQEPIDKEADIRVTVVGDKVFALATYCVNNVRLVDYRDFRVEKRYETHYLPIGIQNLCLEINKRLGLVFSCIDLSIDKKGNYFFLEVNPAGQWLATEVYTGQPLSFALAELLVYGRTK